MFWHAAFAILRPDGESVTAISMGEASRHAPPTFATGHQSETTATAMAYPTDAPAVAMALFPKNAKKSASDDKFWL